MNAKIGVCKQELGDSQIDTSIRYTAKDPIPVIVIGLVGVLKELLAGVNGISDALRDRNS